MKPIREWREYKIEDIVKHLLIVGDLMGDCANCKHVGIEYLDKKVCPSCKTEFKFIASRDPKQSLSLFKKIKERSLGYSVIEYSDFKMHQDREKAKEFFKDAL